MKESDWIDNLDLDFEIYEAYNNINDSTQKNYEEKCFLHTGAYSEDAPTRMTS